MTVLKLSAVSKSFRRGAETVHALDDVDLAVDEGDFVSVVGPSGSGKSTLLHVAGGLDLPDSGTVEFMGTDLQTISAAERAKLRRRHLGFVFQFFHLLPTLTVAENIALPLVLDGRTSRTADADEWVERLGLTDRRDHFPSELSGGQLQRVAIGRALVTRPKLILADEPTGNLDSHTGDDVLNTLIDVVSSLGTALVMVTHDQRAAARATRPIQFRDGRLDEGDQER